MTLEAKKVGKEEKGVSTAFTFSPSPRFHSLIYAGNFRGKTSADVARAKATETALCKSSPSAFQSAFFPGK